MEDTILKDIFYLSIETVIKCLLLPGVPDSFLFPYVPLETQDVPLPVLQGLAEGNSVACNSRHLPKRKILWQNSNEQISLTKAFYKIFFGG